MSNMKMESIPVDIVMVESAITAYGIGSWGDAFLQRLGDLTISMRPDMWIMALFTILPYMLIGAALAKWRLIERAKDLKCALDFSCCHWNCWRVVPKKYTFYV